MGLPKGSPFLIRNVSTKSSVLNHLDQVNLSQVNSDPTPNMKRFTNAGFGRGKPIDGAEQAHPSVRHGPDTEWSVQRNQTLGPIQDDQLHISISNPQHWAPASALSMPANPYAVDREYGRPYPPLRTPSPMFFSTQSTSPISTPILHNSIPARSEVLLQPLMDEPRFSFDPLTSQLYPHVHSFTGDPRDMFWPSRLPQPPVTFEGDHQRVDRGASGQRNGPMQTSVHTSTSLNAEARQFVPGMSSGGAHTTQPILGLSSSFEYKQFLLTRDNLGNHGPQYRPLPNNINHPVFQAGVHNGAIRGDWLNNEFR